MRFRQARTSASKVVKEGRNDGSWLQDFLIAAKCSLSCSLLRHRGIFGRFPAITAVQYVKVFVAPSCGSRRVVISHRQTAKLRQICSYGFTRGRGWRGRDVREERIDIQRDRQTDSNDSNLPSPIHVRSLALLRCFQHLWC